MYAHEGPAMQRSFKIGLELVAIRIPSIGVALPKRLLDVGHAGSDQIRLETKLPKSGQYLALSHCWGGGVPIKTLRENLHAMEEVIRFLDLPKTFQDAVTVTKDLEDWEKESGNMAAIYQNAYLVIGADMAANSEAGFLDPLQGGWHKDGKPIAFVESESTTIYARYYDDHSQLCAMFPTIYGYEDSPLSKRAWTLQEQILAPRMVHFGKREIMWECNSGMFCECMQMDSNMKLQTERVAYLASLNSYPPDKYKTWYKVVNQIMTRTITKRDDIFPALSGLAQQFTDHGAGRYLAGLWLKDLPQDLLWWREYEGERCASSDRAPSWSWASIEDNEQVYHYTDGQLDYTQRLDPVYARVLEAEIEFKGNNLFGAVVSGHLTIYAPLMEVTWKRWFTLEPVRQFSKAPKLSPYFDYKHNLDVSVKLHCLFIGEMSLGGSRTRGLILRKLEDSSESTFKRIGLFQCDSGAKEQFSPALTEETVIIV
ncbi:hypothetical protein BELL_1586g00020 [Botrytis elliptica]|uniref:Heterokaryon incompatibility domain-containing protein n=1 Tax=Botrytis elliptica TaxID=278938 RepID=A0A4Z1HW37_9HELO|nr:hypothetical protein BELL_1586g00020 [Botrytis elliptica]